jgi:hypothetical protein
VDLVGNCHQAAAGFPFEDRGQPGGIEGDRCNDPDDVGQVAVAGRNLVTVRAVPFIEGADLVGEVGFDRGGRNRG